MDKEELIIGLLTEMKAQINSMGERVAHVENVVVRMENDNAAKFGALFDGQRQNSEKLDRIETQVSKHEEIILKRVP